MEPAENKIDHLVLVLGEDGSGHLTSSRARSQTTDTLLKNIIETARLNGVRYLTLYCFDDRQESAPREVSCEVNVLLYLLLIDADWLQDNKVHFSKYHERHEDKIEGLEQIQLVVVSGSNGRFANETLVQNNTATSEKALTGESDQSAELPAADLIIFTGGMKSLETNLRQPHAGSQEAFMKEYWEDLSVQRFEKLLKDEKQRASNLDSTESDMGLHTKVG